MMNLQGRLICKVKIKMRRVEIKKEINNQI